MGLSCFVIHGGGETALYLILMTLYGELKVTVSDVNITLQIPKPGSYKKFTWIYGTDQKIVEQDESNLPEYFKSDNKSQLHNGSLQLYNVKNTDTGDYTLQVVDLQGAEYEWKFILNISDIPPNKYFLHLSCCSGKELSHDYTTSNIWTEEYEFVHYELQNVAMKITHNYSRSNSRMCQGYNIRDNKMVNATISCTKNQESRQFIKNRGNLYSFCSWFHCILYILYHCIIITGDKV
ncbi:protein E5B [Elephant endotheliotropic herpesvirus 2]|nr:protein E5B [Elephant endotheliotropic herpesvirus 2]